MIEQRAPGASVTATGGKWKRDEWPVYFIASQVLLLKYVSECADYFLAAVNELEDPEKLTALIDAEKHILLDSGVYWLSTQHANAHAMSMDEALALSPDEIENFDWLLKLYIEIVKRFGDQLWGYIEIDQGGRENKIKTRAKLEALGLRPIPVYHPLNDGWDYFDYLAERYDRICVGNVVMANAEARKRIVATMWERRRKYPHLWIHVLGLSPNDFLSAYPLNSCDSSTWFASVRWGRLDATANLAPVSRLVQGAISIVGNDADGDKGHINATRFCGYDATMTRLTMAAIADSSRRELGADIGMFDDDDQGAIYEGRLSPLARRAAEEGLPFVAPSPSLPRRGRDRGAPR